MSLSWWTALRRLVTTITVSPARRQESPLGISAWGPWMMQATRRFFFSGTSRRGSFRCWVPSLTRNSMASVCPSAMVWRETAAPV